MTKATQYNKYKTKSKKNKNQQRRKNFVIAFTCVDFWFFDCWLLFVDCFVPKWDCHDQVLVPQSQHAGDQTTEWLYSQFVIWETVIRVLQSFQYIQNIQSMTVESETNFFKREILFKKQQKRNLIFNVLEFGAESWQNNQFRRIWLNWSPCISWTKNIRQITTLQNWKNETHTKSNLFWWFSRKKFSCERWGTVFNAEIAAK